MVKGVVPALPRYHEQDDNVAWVRPKPEVHGRIGQQKQMLSKQLYQRISSYRPELAGKITGMVLEHSPEELNSILNSEQKLLEAIDQVMQVTGATRESDSRQYLHGSSADITFDCDGVAPVQAYAA